MRAFATPKNLFVKMNIRVGRLRLYLALLSTFLVFTQISFAYSVIIGPGTGANGGGDFEPSINDDFISCNWSVANPSSGNHSKWHLKDVGFGASGNKAAYISSYNSTYNWLYNPSGGNATAASYCRLYRLVSIPNGESIINLSFDWQCKGGEQSQDGLQVRKLLEAIRG